MKIKTLTFIIILLISSKSYSQNLHAFIFCNTDDVRLQQCARSNLGRIGPFAAQIAKALNLNYVPHDVLANSFDVSSFNNAIKNTNISPEDVVILYVNTHGENSVTFHDIFPLIWVPTENYLVSASKMHLLLYGKGPKTVITIVEACNSIEKVDLQHIFVIGQGAASTTPDLEKRNLAIETNNIRKIFSSPMNLLICSGNKGATTFGTILGSYYTTNFLNAFRETIQLPAGNKYVAMDSVLKRASILTYKQSNYTYHPIWAKIKTTQLRIIQQGPDHTDLQTTTGLDDNADYDLFTAMPQVESQLTLNVETKKLPVVSFPRITNNQNYRVKLTIGNRNTTGQLDSVVYFLDATMPRPEVATNNVDDDFYYTFTVINTYPIKAKVYHHDGLIEELYGEIKKPD